MSKYIWRGQRLTNDWSMQPSMTFGASGFSFNVWGNMDLAAVNEGDSLFIRENPLAPAGDHSGLKGHFSEIDYTFSFAYSFEQMSVDVGTIFYTFPDRSAALPNNTFSALDLSTSLSFVNSGFGDFYYGSSNGGAHDFNVTVSLPIALTESVSANGFVSYSALLGDFRDSQFLDPGTVFLGTSGSPRGLADTVYGGVSLSVGF